MDRDPWLLLRDAKHSAEVIPRITTGSPARYSEDELIRPAVERHLEISGEALNRLRRADPELAARVADLHRAVAFRNILIHGHGMVDDTTVWRTIEQNLQNLLIQVDLLITEREAS